MNTNDCRVVIVVPVYKDTFTTNEEISVIQLKRVLNKYRIIYVSPKRLKHSNIIAGDHTSFFDDSYFESTVTYSQLLLSEEFYSKFLEYEYILIYQTDAFVFYDRLEEWCNKGFDYIGAPLSSKLKYWEDINTNVGNGGLSLRNVRSCMRVLQYKDDILSQHPLGWKMQEAEDLFFSYCGTCSYMNFNIPSDVEAMKFSMQGDIHDEFSHHSMNSLPFGVHAWDWIDSSHWRPYIESYGYVTAHDKIELTSINAAQNYAFNEIMTEISGGEKKDFCLKMQNWLNDLCGKNRHIIIWGAGQVGNKISQLLDRGKVTYRLSDRNENISNNIIRMTDDILSDNNNFFIVASSKYRNEMTMQLENKARIYKKDYIYYDDLLNSTVQLYPYEYNKLKSEYLMI